jgi:hypothetical protein
VSTPLRRPSAGLDPPDACAHDAGRLRVLVRRARSSPGATERRYRGLEPFVANDTGVPPGFVSTETGAAHALTRPDDGPAVYEIPEESIEAFRASREAKERLLR